MRIRILLFSLIRIQNFDADPDLDPASDVNPCGPGSATLLTTFKNYNLATQAKEWLTQCNEATENTYKKVDSSLYNAGVRREFGFTMPEPGRDQGAKLFILSESRR